MDEEEDTDTPTLLATPNASLMMFRGHLIATLTCEVRR